MQDKLLMIYGANGYTGKLIVKEAVSKGFKPIIAGRNKTAIEQLAKEYSLKSRAFSLDELSCVEQNLSDIFLVIHCAGPFSSTAKPMIQGCLASKTHYTDITGEIAVFELAQSLNDKAKQADIILCPGVGFDVIPTDCLASMLKDKMPDATHLVLGFDSGSGMSPGTAKTSVEGLADGGKVRKNGVITTVPLAYKERTIDFGNGSKNAVTIPWGDVSTAFYSTNIANIEVYIPMSPKAVKGMRKLNWFKWLLSLNVVQNFMKKKVEQKSTGPNEQQREKLRTFLWGEVRNSKGDILTAKLETLNGYQLTYITAIEVAKFLFDDENQAIAGGAYTPSTLIDNQLIFKVPSTGDVVYQEGKY